jgi:hypothetical protein
VRATRLLVGMLGLAATAYGVVLLLGLGQANLEATATWLVAGVVLHDGVLAPLTILVCLAGGALLGRWRAAFAAGLVVLGTITLTAVPVLSGNGERPDNPTLLDRPYWAGWLIVAVIVLAGIVLGGWVSARAGRQPPSPAPEPAE